MAAVPLMSEAGLALSWETRPLKERLCHTKVVCACLSKCRTRIISFPEVPSKVRTLSPPFADEATEARFLSSPHAPVSLHRELLY